MAHKRVFYTGQAQHFMRLGVTLQPGENVVDDVALETLLENPEVRDDLAILGAAPEVAPATVAREKQPTQSAAAAAEEA